MSLMIYLEKNRLLRQSSAVQAGKTSKVIPKPKGSVGCAGYCLITKMKLNKEKGEDRILYNDILVSACAILNNARLQIR
jgi:hypothetical protein